MPSVALLSLLGAAALAGVRSAPVEKDDRVEEMVTRCIVEVLLNSLSKPNAPPINPLCKEFLKKSSQQTPEKKRVGQDTELNTMLSSEPKELERPPERTLKEQLNEEEFKRQAAGGEKGHPEEGKLEGKGNQQFTSPGSHYSYDEAHKEEGKNEDEKGKGENGSYTRNYHSKEGSREKNHNEEMEEEPPDKKSLSTVGRGAEGDYKHSVGLKHPEESVHSQEKGNQESKEEEEEEEEEESSEKYHHNFHREFENSYKKEAEAEKRDHKPRQNHRKPRLGNSEYRRHHNGEKKDSPEKSSEEEDDFWDKRSPWPKHYYESGHHYEEKRNSEEEMEGGGRSQEYFEKRHGSEEEMEGGGRSQEYFEKRHGAEETEGGGRSQDYFEKKHGAEETEGEGRSQEYFEKRHGAEETEGEGRSQEYFEKRQGAEETEGGGRSQEYFEKRHGAEETEGEGRSQEYFEKRHGTEETEGGGRSQEYFEKRHHNKEEEEDTRHHGKEREEKQPKYERKRVHDEPQKEARHHYEERNPPQAKPSEEYVGKRHSYGGWDEKRHLDREWQRLQAEEIPKSPSIGVEGGEQRFYRPEEEAREEKRHYPSVLEEELEKRHPSEGKNRGVYKRTFLVEEGYPRSHYLVQNVKRAAASYVPYYQQLKWKNRHAEKRDDMANLFLESEEEPRSRLDERDLFPDYNEYEPWEKKQLADILSRKHSENSRHGKTHKFDVKRQYNRMDELAHLLSNRKKSAEFPELYSSSEDAKRGHVIRSDEGRLGQRPLTREEEKELENLAAMDLELQKMAEKFNNNRQG